MSQHVQRNIAAPLRTGLTRTQLWEAADQGLIKCWEVGRQRAARFPHIAQQCRDGELPVLGWKGGVSRSLKKLEKYGSLKYLAQWQGLRGEDLNIDLSEERSLTCSRTKMVVTFTPDRTKYFNQMAEAEA
jgi:CubicO group peptidase (beta-lactamase class C family)